MCIFASLKIAETCKNVHDKNRGNVYNEAKDI